MLALSNDLSCSLISDFSHANTRLWCCWRKHAGVLFSGLLRPALISLLTVFLVFLYVLLYILQAVYRVVERRITG